MLGVGKRRGQRLAEVLIVFLHHVERKIALVAMVAGLYKQERGFAKVSVERCARSA